MNIEGLNVEGLKMAYYKNINRINNAEKWFREHDPVDDDSKEYRALLELVKETYQLHYKLFLLGVVE